MEPVSHSEEAECTQLSELPVPEVKIYLRERKLQKKLAAGGERN